MALPSLADGFVSLADDDLSPSFPQSGIGSDIAPTRCTYPGCTSEVVRKSNKGPAPKLCEEHKNAKAKAAPNAPKGPSWANAGAVEAVLTKYLSGLGMAVSFVNPADGSIIAEGCGPVAHEIVELGRQDKKLRGWLEKLATPGKYGPLLLVLFPIIVGIMANHGLLPEFSILPKTPKEGEPT